MIDEPQQHGTSDKWSSVWTTQSLKVLQWFVSTHSVRIIFVWVSWSIIFTMCTSGQIVWTRACAKLSRYPVLPTTTLVPYDCSSPHQRAINEVDRVAAFMSQIGSNLGNLRPNRRPKCCTSDPRSKLLNRSLPACAAGERRAGSTEPQA